MNIYIYIYMHIYIYMYIYIYNTQGESIKSVTTKLWRNEKKDDMECFPCITNIERNTK